MKFSWIGRKLTPYSSTVNNDFQQPRTIFDLFDGLEVKDMDVPVSPAESPAAKDLEPVPEEANGTKA